MHGWTGFRGHPGARAVRAWITNLSFVAARGKGAVQDTLHSIQYRVPCYYTLFYTMLRHVSIQIRYVYVGLTNTSLEENLPRIISIR
jgi:hypothetical protein